MKKTLKIIGLYFAFGVIISILITAFGGYEDLLINQTMGNIGVSGYITIMLYVIVFWLPGFVTMLFSKHDYLAFLYAKPILFVFIAAFIFLSIYIIRRRNKKQV